MRSARTAMRPTLDCGAACKALIENRGRRRRWHDRGGCRAACVLLGGSIEVTHAREKLAELSGALPPGRGCTSPPPGPTRQPGAGVVAARAAATCRAAQRRAACLATASSTAAEQALATRVDDSWWSRAASRRRGAYSGAMDVLRSGCSSGTASCGRALRTSEGSPDISPEAVRRRWPRRTLAEASAIEFRIVSQFALAAAPIGVGAARPRGGKPVADRGRHPGVTRRRRCSSTPGVRIGLGRGAPKQPAAC